jgi:hypothetical protein
MAGSPNAKWLVPGNSTNFCADDVVGEVPAGIDCDPRVADPVQDQRRHADRRQNVLRVDLAVHAQYGCCSRWARALPLAARKPAQRVGVEGEIRRKCVGHKPAGAPFAIDPDNILFEPLPRERGVPSEGTIQHQRPSTLGIGCGEQQAHRSALGYAEQRCALRTGRVHHRAHVVHALFESRNSREPIRQAGAALVEQDQAREAGEAGKEFRVCRVLPGNVEVRDKARHINYVERPVADDLVGDVDVAAFGVTGFRRFHRGLPCRFRQNLAPLRQDGVEV